MHTMNTNRISDGGTSAALGEEAIKRIAEKVKTANTRKTKKRANTIKKTAKKIEKKADKPIQIKVANINDISSDFEKIGTGFYRKGHHLWEISPSEDGGLVLTRKHGEDHVIGYDPEPIIRSAKVKDRFGQNIKIGSKIKLPHNGKIATGEVVLIDPGALGLNLLSGESISAPPDMCEVVIEEVIVVPEEELKTKETKEEDNKEDKEFEPDVEPPSKKNAQVEQVVPSEQPGLKPGKQPPPAGGPEMSKWRTKRELSFPTEKFEEMKKESKLFTDLINNQGRLYIRSSREPTNWYEVELREVAGGQPTFSIQGIRLSAAGGENITNWDQFKNFEEQLGGYMTIGGIGVHASKEAKKLVYAVKAAFDSLVPDLHSWNEYWYEVGQRVAAGNRKPLTPEQRERRKQRRKERKMERAGLPPGTPLPPKPKTGQLNEEEADKEMLRAYQQLVDEIEYILKDEKLQENSLLLADEMERTLENFHMQLEEVNEEVEDEMEDELSIETPPKEDEDELLSKMSKRIRVSMEDL